MDGVDTAAGACVTAGGASRGGGSLSGGVADTVTRAGATALESVVETNPVTDLVGNSLSRGYRQPNPRSLESCNANLALVVVGGAAAGDRGEEENNTVVGGGAGVVGGEGRVSEETFTGT